MSIKSSFGPNEHTTGQQKRFFQFRKSRGAEIETFRKRLSECLDKDEEGRLKMTITLPDGQHGKIPGPDPRLVRGEKIGNTLGFENARSNPPLSKGGNISPPFGKGRWGGILGWFFS